MAKIKFKLTGIRPLLQHNEQLANPLNPVAKELKAITGKRNKTDQDHEDMAKIEFRGGIYISDSGPYLPSTWIERALLDSAKKEKLGTTFKSYLQCDEDRLRLDYKGPRTIQELWEAGFYDQRMVKVQTTKTLRTRPMFPVGWSILPTFIFDESHIEQRQIVRCMERAGDGFGIGDFRPRFGRFAVEVVK
jgi:hypothetical protein